MTEARRMSLLSLVGAACVRVRRTIGLGESSEEFGRPRTSELSPHAFALCLPNANLGGDSRNVFTHWVMWKYVNQEMK